MGIRQYPRHVAIPPAGTGGEQPVVADLVGAWRWNQRGESFEEFPPFHPDVGRAVAPAGLQPVGQAAIGHGLEALHREWGPRHVAAQSLEAAAISRWNGHVGM